MGLRQLKSSLRDEIMSTKHTKTYEAARSREPALAEHAGILPVLAVLGDESERRYAERDAITRALVREHQRAPSAFWSATLILAYTPMLLRLRGRICGDAFARDDLDQMVVGAFLEAVSAFALEARPTRIAMLLRQDTQRAIFRRLRVEQSLQKRLAQMAESAIRDEHFELFASEPSSGDLDDDEREELTALLLALAGSVVPRARLEPIIATRLRGENLRAYVMRVHPGLDAVELEAAYQRIKRDRLRTAAKLRAVLAHEMSRIDGGQALPPQPL